MRLRVTFTLLTFIVPFALPAAADAQIPGVRIGLAGGPSFPIGDLGNQAGTGFHARGSLGLEIPLLPLGVRGDLLWHQFAADAADGHFTGVGGLVNGTWRMPFPIVQPYLVAGAGFMRYSDPDITVGGVLETGESGTEFAFAAGGGVQLRLLRLGGFVEARYLDWGRHRALPVTIGITF